MEEEDDLFDVDWNGQEVKQQKVPQNTMKTKDLLLAFDIKDKEDYCDKLLKTLDGLEGKHKWKMNENIAQVRKSIEFISALLQIQWPYQPEGLSSMFYHLTQIPFHLRWQEYLSWRTKVVEVLEERIGHLEVAIRAQANVVREVETTQTAEIIRSADVVGITTSGAAKQKPMLEHLKCKIGNNLNINFPIIKSL